MPTRVYIKCQNCWVIIFYKLDLTLHVGFFYWLSLLNLDMQNTISTHILQITSNQTELQSALLLQVLLCEYHLLNQLSITKNYSYCLRTRYTVVHWPKIIVADSPAKFNFAASSVSDIGSRHAITNISQISKTFRLLYVNLFFFLPRLRIRFNNTSLPNPPKHPYTIQMLKDESRTVHDLSSRTYHKLPQQNGEGQKGWQRHAVRLAEIRNSTFPAVHFIRRNEENELGRRIFLHFLNPFPPQKVLFFFTELSFVLALFQAQNGDV